MKIAHSLRDGTFWDSAPAVEPTGEIYDLVIVGGGISGLAAAHLFRQRRPEAKILILENNDDFGGHATRNEFVAANGKRIIGYGGSQSLQTPSFFSPLVNKVMADIGIEPEKFESWYDADWWDRVGVPGDAQFYGSEVFGTDALVTIGEDSAWIAETPLNDRAKADLIRITDAPEDYLAGKSRTEKHAALAAMSYAEFLTGPCGCDPQVVLSFAPDEWLATTADCYPAIDAWAIACPALTAWIWAMRRSAPIWRRHGCLPADPDEYIYHFPDGNGGLARALLRSLIRPPCRARASRTWSPRRSTMPPWTLPTIRCGCGSARRW